MKLYHLTAIPPTAINHLIQGSFTGPRQQELVTATTSTLHLYRLQPKQSQLQPLFRLNTFSLITQLSVFRLPGTRRDHIVLLSDSGNLTILQADIATRTFSPLHCEPFGRTGIRRCVPSHYLTVEPRGRACIVGALEKQKFCYVLNRDVEERVTISSPLSCHRSNVVTYSMVAVDVGFENPMFASLERSYDTDAPKMLVYYELDLGLNTVVRKLQSPVRDSSLVMLMVPGGDDGPGGVLICSEGFVSYRNLLLEDDNGKLSSSSQKYQLEAPLPHREYMPLTSMIVSGTMYHDRKGSAFFFLLSTEFGDLIKADLEWSPEKGVHALRLSYFDSLPAPVVALCIFRSGFLFVSMDSSDSLLLQFRMVDVPDKHQGQSSVRLQLSQGDMKDIDVELNGVRQESNCIVSEKAKLRYREKSRLEFLILAASLESFSPLLAMSNIELETGENALLCSSGRGSAGSIRLLRRGIGILEMSEPLGMPGRIANVFSFKKTADNTFDSFIVVAFAERTKVLAVGESKVEETADSGFELNRTTICAAQIGLSSIVQVYRNGIRYIPNGKVQDATKWKPPVPTHITAACCNNAQVIIALSSGAILYFEVDFATDVLLEVDKVSGALHATGGDQSITHGATDDVEVPALAVPDVPHGRTTASIFAVAGRNSNKVRLYHRKADGKLKALGLHVAPAAIESLALVDFGHVRTGSDGTAKNSGSNEVPYEPMLTLIIGTKQGALVRLKVDSVTGAMSGKRSTFLGPGLVRLQPARLAGVPTCMVLAGRPWILFRQGARLVMSQMCTNPISRASSFSSEQSPDGFVAVSGSRLHLLCVDLLTALSSSAQLPAKIPPACVPVSTVLGSSFHISRTRSLATPRKLVKFDNATMPKRNTCLPNGDQKKPSPAVKFMAIETDHRMRASKPPKVDPTKQHANADAEVKQPKDHSKGSKHASLGRWHSRMRFARLCTSEEDHSPDDNDEDEDGEGEFDSSNIYLNDGPQAFKDIEVLNSKDERECFLCACVSNTLGGRDSIGRDVSYMVVSVAKNLAPSATSGKSSAEIRRLEKEERKLSGALRVYKIEKETERLVFIHETQIECPCYVVVAFRDMILVGIGRALRLYDLGKQRLLRKSEYKLAVKNSVTAIAVCGGERVFVGDVQDSVTLFKYIAGDDVARSVNHIRATAEREGGRFVCVAADTLSRWIVCLVTLDYSSVCGSDKFGNIFVLRLPPELSSVTEEMVGVAKVERGAGIGGTRKPGHRLQVEASVHVGATVASLALGSLTGFTLLERGGQETDGNSHQAIVYSTMDGAVGILAPMTGWSEAEFARVVEHEMRRQYSPISGRDHLSYRSSFYALKNVIDGDLCEMLGSLSHEDVVKVCDVVGQPISEVMRKIEELREAWMM